ncbi:LacI family DNA-binding transcriptional regulator [Haloferula sp. A504]|uniref:LacI family DNA-binding transcriptional regulator n=1 Tax=Haloferula sp. A504 TaxID=3373601 RepID=UPI0031CB232F|nr:LacI family transcriptional regulator [Verrucomicrobiaceae bacterium E54]
MPGGEKEVTLKDIAELVGCSQATVSNAINGRGRMSAKVREEILARCAELHFVPNSAGRSLRLRRADAVGVIYAPSFAELFGNVFYARIMEGLAESFGEAGLDLILGNRTDADGLPTIVSQGKVDALVVLAGVFQQEDFAKLRRCRVPMCIVDGHVGSMQADSLTTDGYGGGLKVAEHFIERGHRRIMMVAYKTPLYNIEQRIAGFLSGLRAGGVQAEEKEVILRVSDDEDAASQVLARLDQDQPPTGIFAVNDTLADHLLNALAGKGIKTPDDVSMVGFDNDPLAARSSPPLTTVGVDKRVFGSLSAKLVLDRLSRPGGPPVHQVQPTNLIVRESVAVPL